MVNRKVYGYDVPRYTPAEIERRFGISVTDSVYSSLSGPNCWILPFISDDVNVNAVTVSIGDRKEMVTQRRITDAAYLKFGKKPWYDALQYAGLEVNGQVKNFLVALRTYWGTKPSKTISILIKGSKMASDSGLWVKAYGMFLTTIHDKVDITCYDMGETDCTEEAFMQYGVRKSKLKITRIADYYYADGKGYDVFIDDAYVQGSVPVAPHSEFYSLKKPGVGELFFSATEVRRFSSQLPKPVIETSCHCNVCTMLSSIVTTFDSFNYLRGHLVSFGAPICDSIEFRGDQQAKAHLRKDLHTQPSVVLVEPHQRRAAIALSEEENLRTASGPLDVQLSVKPELKPSDYVHGVGFCSTYDAIEYSHFTGKNVKFQGVEPSILGTTVLDRGAPQTIAIGDKLELLLGTPLPELWCPVDKIPGYIRCSESLGPYNRFVKKGPQLSRVTSRFSDIGGRPLTETIECVMHTGGRYNISQMEASTTGVPLSPPIMDLIPYKGKLACADDNIRYCVHDKSVSDCIVPLIDHVSSGTNFAKGVGQVPKTAIERCLVYYGDRRTFEVFDKHRRRVKYRCAHYFTELKEGCVYEYGFDAAIKALKSGGEINPGPDLNLLDNFDYHGFIYLLGAGDLLRYRHGAIYVDFPLYASFPASQDDEHILYEIADRVKRRMEEWAGNTTTALFRYHHASLLERIRIREELTAGRPV